MRVAKAEADHFHERFKDAQKKTENLLGDAGKGFSDVFSNMKFKSAWFGSGGSDTSPSNGGSLDRAPLATYLAGPAQMPPPIPIPGYSAPVDPDSQTPRTVMGYPPLQPSSPASSASTASAVPSAPQPWQDFAAPAQPATSSKPHKASLPPTPLSSTEEDDLAMRQHFGALERLVSMGLTPQAARAALRHFDEWLTSQDGVAAMARSEASAREAGEPILHIGDHVCLEGLVKNSAANGKMAVLQAYVAENQRWKVALNDGKTYLLQPKFLQPVAVKPTAYLQQLEEATATAASSPQASEPLSAEAQRARAEEDAKREDEAERMRQQEEELHRRSDELARREELLDANSSEIRRKRASLAMVQAHVANMIEKSESGGEPKTHRFSLADDEIDTEEMCIAHEASEEDGSSASAAQESASDGQADDDDGDVWDMDWSAMASPSPTDSRSPAQLADSSNQLLDIEDPDFSSTVQQLKLDDDCSASTTASTSGSSMASPMEPVSDYSAAVTAQENCAHSAASIDDSGTPATSQVDAEDSEAL